MGDLYPHIHRSVRTHVFHFSKVNNKVTKHDNCKSLELKKVQLKYI